MANETPPVPNVLLMNQEQTVQSGWDVFLCYNSTDRPFVAGIEEQLRIEGLVAWLDQSTLPAGSYWLEELDKALNEGRIRSAAIFVGGKGIGDSQDLEIRMMTDQWSRKRLPVIPVILPDVIELMHLPPLLRYAQHFDFRRQAEGATRALADAIKRTIQSSAESS